MNRFIRQAVVVLGTVAALSACDEVVGNGEMVTESVVTPPFTKVDVSNALVAFIHDAPTAVTITMDQNIMPLIRTRVVGDTLYVDVEDDESIVPSSGAHLEISAPGVEALSLSGASVARLETHCAELRLEASGSSEIRANVAADAVFVDVSGASEATLTGTATSLDVDASGSSDVDSTLPVTDAYLSASGASDLSVTATERVDVEASGASTVEIQGNPTHRQIDTSGSSTVRFE